MTELTSSEVDQILERWDQSTPALKREVMAEFVARCHQLEQTIAQGNDRTLRCAFCGEAYPPDTPGAQHERLTAHIHQCPQHPLREVIEERDRLRQERQKILPAVGQSCSAISLAMVALQQAVKTDASATLVGFSIRQTAPDLQQHLAAAISAWAFLGDPDDIIAELDWQNIARELENQSAADPGKEPA